MITYHPPILLCSKHIKFGVLTPQEIVEMAEIEVCNRELYNVTNRTPVKYGCLDRRLVRATCIIRIILILNVSFLLLIL